MHLRSLLLLIWSSVFEIVLSGLLNVPPDYTIEPLRYENVPGEGITIADYQNLNFRRHGREIFLEGNYTFTEDVDNTFVRGIESYYSASGAGDFKQMPFTLPESPLCDFYNTSYRTYVEPHFLGKTNFPKMPPEGICPIPAGNYWAKDVVLKDDMLPLHLPRGVWRVEEKLYRTKPQRQMVGGLNVYVRIVDRIK